MESWGRLGALLGALGTFSGPSLALLGALLGHLGASVRSHEPIGSDKARRQTTLIFRRSGAMLASLGGPWRVRRALETVLWPS
eukprot:3496470-Pyramimonas_sp.AAC.1